MYIITHRRFFYIFSAILLTLSVLAVGVLGLKRGIDFTGGSLLEVVYTGDRPAVEEIRTELEKLGWVGTAVQETGEKGVIVRAKSLTEAERQQLVSAVSFEGKQNIEERRFDSVGPTIGAELQQRAWIAILAVLFAIICFIAYAFRHVSEPVSSWTYGSVAIVALLHDVFIPVGFFTVWGHYHLDAQIDILFVMAILTVLGFSVHDTIVVFDRTRENLKHRDAREDFATTVGRSVSQTFARSINTSLTVLLVILALYFVGAESTRNFALILAVGVLVGTYSSVFVASPLLVTIDGWKRKGSEAEKKGRGK